MILASLAVALLLLGLAFSVTNPFSRITIVGKPMKAVWRNGTAAITDNSHQIVVRNSLLWRWFAWLKAGFHIMQTRYVSSPGSTAATVPGIIKDIHRLRYDPTKLLLISGDHFSPLFVRNLGVFYYPMLDTAIPGSSTDWQNRQTVYLETTAFALGVFAKTDRLTTTIVSTARYGVTCTNFYAYPSDTLFGILYALSALQGKQTARPARYGTPLHTLNTIEAATQLREQYHDALCRLYADYRQTVFDERTGLIKKQLHLSGAKDITRRYSAFYDNVIFWKTTELAMQFGLIASDKDFLQTLKQTILQTFWLPKAGYFLEDLSDEGIKNAYYSSDWLVVLWTGFLDPAKARERAYFERSVAYIDAQGIDKPFAIKYQQDRRAHRQFLAVRLAVASYGGDAIWSFWGMEYIKTLLLLYRNTGNKGYLTKADTHIRAYKRAMLRDRGFPEVYDASGKLLQTPFYRSIRQTGWVIGFEQVLELRKSL
jgi:hypothetical protein